MTDPLSAIHIYIWQRVSCTTTHTVNPLVMCVQLYTKCVAKSKYGLSIKDSRNLKTQSENNDDNNNAENNCKNTNLDGALIFQDTGNNVV